MWSMVMDGHWPTQVTSHSKLKSTIRWLAIAYSARTLCLSGFIVRNISLEQRQNVSYSENEIRIFGDFGSGNEW